MTPETRGNVLTYDDLVKLLRPNDYLNIQGVLDLATTIKEMGGSSMNVNAEAFPGYYMDKIYNQFTSLLIPDLCPVLLPTIDETLGGVGIGRPIYIHNDTESILILTTTSGELIDEAVLVGQDDFLFLLPNEKIALRSFTNTLWKVSGTTKIQRLCASDLAYYSDTGITIAEGGLIQIPSGVANHVLYFQPRCAQNEKVLRYQFIGGTGGAGIMGTAYQVYEFQDGGATISIGTIYDEAYNVAGSTLLSNIPNSNLIDKWFVSIMTGSATNFNLYEYPISPLLVNHNANLGVYFSNPTNAIYLIGIDVQVFERFSW